MVGQMHDRRKFCSFLSPPPKFSFSILGGPMEVVMIRNHFHLEILKRSILFLLCLSSMLVPGRAKSYGAKKEQRVYTSHDKAFYLSQDQVSFVRPGLKFTIQSATIRESDLKIQVTFSITDDLGLPLDRQGIYTPGPVSTVLPERPFQRASLSMSLTQRVFRPVRLPGTRPRKQARIRVELIPRSVMVYIPTLLPRSYQRTLIGQ